MRDSPNASNPTNLQGAMTRAAPLSEVVAQVEVPTKSMADPQPSQQKFSRVESSEREQLSSDEATGAQKDVLRRGNESQAGKSNCLETARWALMLIWI
jgi:hypothetical protein